MKILVTGGCGFIGSYLVHHLASKGHQVTVLDCNKTESLPSTVSFVKGDVCDRQILQQALKGIEAVYHLAGEASIERAIQNPVASVQANVLGTTILLDECAKAKVKRFIFASSVYVFSRAGGVYRSTKRACESLIRDYFDHYGLPFTILRFGTVYGPRYNIGNSLYRYISQAIDGKIVYHGDGSEIRQLVHVLDVARLCEMILEDQYANQSIVITGQDTMKMRDVFTMISEILGKDVKVEYQKRNSDKPDAHYLVTPYSYDIDHGKKLSTNYYIDLGQGLLECVQHILDKKQNGQPV